VYEDLRRRSAEELVARSRYTLQSGNADGHNGHGNDHGNGIDGYYIAGLGLGETREQRREVRSAPLISSSSAS
jgi:hypothetical protein